METDINKLTLKNLINLLINEIIYSINNYLKIKKYLKFIKTVFI